jgi:hypothetical protein
VQIRVAGQADAPGLAALAASARRSALAFLVDYNLAAGRWATAAGVRMPSPVLQRP